MTQPIELASKDSYLLVKFTYGDPASPTASKYTNWLSPFDTTYTSVPSLEVVAALNTGVLDEQICSISMPAGFDDFVTQASNGQPFSPIFVEVLERSSNALALVGDPSQTIVLFRGQVSTARKNPQGKAGSVTFECVTDKAQLQVAMGISCDLTCAWTLGGRGCGVAVPVNSGVLALGDGNKTVVITGLPALADPSDTRYYARGYLSYLGLTIAIRDWDTAVDDTRFVLALRPPAFWYGATVAVVPGCDKTIEVCRSRWLNEANFGGFGYAMPNYHPIFEQP